MRGQVTWRVAPIFGLLALLLLACLTYRVPSEEVRQARSNTLDEVIGEAELLVPAERKAVGSIISPGGHWLLVKFGRAEWVVFDLDSGVEQALALSCAENPGSWVWARWLNERQFVITTPLSRCYYLVEMPDATATLLPIVSEDPARLAEASPPLYITKSLARGGPTAFALGDDPFVMHLHNPEHAYDPPPWAAAIPHIEVPRPVPGWVQPLQSRTQCFYATGGDQEMSVFSSNGQLLAQASKEGWSFYILGWAHDDSGIYVRMAIGGGSDGAVFYPWEVIWKLKVPEGASCGAGD